MTEWCFAVPLSPFGQYPPFWQVRGVLFVFMGFDNFSAESPKRKAALSRKGIQHAREGEERRQKALDIVTEDPTISVDEMCARVGVKPSTYWNWRRRAPEFAAKMDAIRQARIIEASAATGGEDPEDPAYEKVMSFEDFRFVWLNTHTPWFQRLMIEQYETMAKGHTVLILVPPEHGKTTLFEDYATWRACYWPNWKNLVITKSLPLGRKMCSRVRNRLEPDGPFPKLVTQFGPFAPVKGSGSAQQQTWGAERFSIFKKKQFDDRSYTMEALGAGSSIAGARTDQLHCDDIQELKNLNLTEQLWNDFTQDWITRPGPHGKTSVNGTRVGVGDFYERLMEEWSDDLLTVVKFPAIVTNQITGEEEPLWPERYSLDDMELMRKKVGEEKWSRNYMQEPVDATFGTFNSDMLAECCNPMRSIQHPPKPDAVLGIGLDPAIGSTNAFVVVEYTPDKLVIRRVRADVGLSRNEDIMQILEDLVVTSRPGYVRDVVIEAMAFQRGLTRDDRLRELAKKHRFTTSEHLTGVNKYDENIGIASMADSFMRGEIEIPWAEDHQTRYEMQALITELLAWRPGRRGTQLRQDRVMALWFIWIRWMNQYRNTDAPSIRSTVVPKTAGTPWKPTPMPGMTRFRRSA